MSVFVAGALHLDVVLQAPRLPRLDETLTGSAVHYVFGGKGGNQAVAAARMGADVAFAGRIGKDAFGATLRDTLLAADINIDQLQTDTGASGMSAAIVDDHGDYGAVIVSAANLGIEHDAITIPPSTRLVLLQNEVPEVVNLSVAQKARQAGAKVWLNAAPARQLSPDLLDAVDVFIVNRVEAAFYGSALPKAQTLTTLGPDGVQHGTDTHAGYAVDVVSTHGAGDMFVGALAAQVAGGALIRDAIDFAQAAAALHVSLPVDARETLTPDRVARFRTGQPKR
ncbi:MAG: PfkB family carbohydrate kinase [Tateyamaria sp.]